MRDIIVAYHVHGVRVVLKELRAAPGHPLPSVYRTECVVHCFRVARSGGPGSYVGDQLQDKLLKHGRAAVVEQFQLSNAQQRCNSAIHDRSKPPTRCCSHKAQQSAQQPERRNAWEPDLSPSSPERNVSLSRAPTLPLCMAAGAAGNADKSGAGMMRSAARLQTAGPATAATATTQDQGHAPEAYPSAPPSLRS
jgi:hypothetical protein